MCIDDADHRETAATVNNLAGALDDQGRYGEAIPLYERALNIREKLILQHRLSKIQLFCSTIL